MKVLISTDTSCVINYEAFKKHEISVFPLNVIVDDQEFHDGVTITQDELKVAMRSGKKIHTSTPPLGDVISYFEDLLNKGYDHIIHFTISSHLSSMNDLFNNIVKQNFAGKVTIIDSLSLSTAMLALVFTAYDDAKNGKSVEEIVKSVEERKNKDYLVFVPENLTALKNGGRISPAVAVIGNALGIKPVINLIDGKLEKTKTTRQIKQTFRETIDTSLQTYAPSDYDYALVSFDANEGAFNFIYNYLQDALGDNKAITGVIPINVCAHCGPGTLGLIVTKKVNGKSLSEFI
ncbi:MAG: DegV family protein [Clostridia bacterium]|nr:DegV family protein [Clostridia bacterium]